MPGGSRRPASILAAACYILQEKPYRELGGHYLMHHENTEHATRRLVQELERLEQRVARQPSAGDEVNAHL
jgi:hypothetical protein